MSDRALLTDYRERVLALRELEEQIARCGVTGAPVGQRPIRLEGMPRGTNEPVAAAMQLSDGLEAMAKRQRQELHQLWPAVLALTSRIDDARLYMIVHQYFVLARSMEEIACRMFISSRTVARLKKGYLDSLA